MTNKTVLQFISSLLLVFLLFPAILKAQSSTITGMVKDASGNGIASVTVNVKGKDFATTTAADGSFSLLIPGPKSVVEFSSVGFKNKSVVLSGEENITVVLQESSSQLGEVVVTGYGTQKKSNLTGAVASIGNKDFKDQPVSNLAASLQGKLSGINVTSPSGTPGAGLLVSIRGAQNPLYVVDGIPMLSESNSSLSTSFNTTGEETGQGQNISFIADINPNDIESIEIL